MFTKIATIIDGIDVSYIDASRKEILQQLINFIQSNKKSEKAIALNFICTHNSRRSHLSQVWAQTLAYYYNIPKVACYSGGTEATAMFPVAVTTLENQGFEIQRLTQITNPIYAIKYSNNNHPIIGFSKKFDDSFNPKNNFAAIMTCSSADKGCPFIAGAQKRIPLTFEDPKAFDNTTLQADKYAERSLEIATELKYVFSKIS